MQRSNILASLCSRHAQIQKVLSEGVQPLKTFFLVDEGGGGDDPNTL